MTIHKSILIEADAQAVFEAIARGLLFEMTDATQISHDFRPGGGFELSFGQRGTISGNYKSIESHRIEVTWNVCGFDLPDEKTLLLLEIQATGRQQSQLAVTHENPSPNEFEWANWKSILSQCQKRLGKQFQVCEVPFSLNDLEADFQLAADYQEARLSFRDWQNRQVEIRFGNVFKACIFNANGYRNLPSACLVEIFHSEEISELLECGLAGPGDDLHHYVLSSNQERWAELLASSYSVQVEPA